MIEDLQMMEKPEEGKPAYYYSYYRRRGYYYSYYRRRSYYSSYYYYSAGYRRRYSSAEVEKPEEPAQLFEDQGTEDANSNMITVAVFGLLVGVLGAVAFVLKRRRTTNRTQPLLEN